MSKRCELKKEYYKIFGSYKIDSKNYIKWLEDKIIKSKLSELERDNERLKMKVKKLEGILCKIRDNKPTNNTNSFYCDNEKKWLNKCKEQCISCAVEMIRTKAQ